MPELAEYRRYARTPNGSLIEIVESHEGATALPNEAVEVDPATWETELAAWQRAVDELHDALAAAERAQAEATHGALVALGLPEAVARHLAGWPGDASP